MVSALISRVVILVFGTLYPAYASYKAVKTKNVKEYVKWMMYWIVFAFFTCIETFADIFIAWLPFYYELKILFVLWLLSPATKGASYLYRKFVHPQLAKREKEIDGYIMQASDKGYSAVISLGSKGLSYATNVVLSTAIKGQSKIADHLKRSYSMSDLSSDTTDGRQFRKDSVNEEEFDDETDNRLIEESYQREIMEKESLDEDAPIRPRRRQRQQLNEPDLDRVSEGEEDINIRGSRSKSKAYTHKEPVVLTGGTRPEGKSALSSSPTCVTVYRRVLSTSDAVSPSGARVTVTRSHSLGSADLTAQSSFSPAPAPPSGYSSSTTSGDNRADLPSSTAPWRIRSAYRSNKQ